MPAKIDAISRYAYQSIFICVIQRKEEHPALYILEKTEPRTRYAAHKEVVLSAVWKYRDPGIFYMNEKNK